MIFEPTHLWKGLERSLAEHMEQQRSKCQWTPRWSLMGSQMRRAGTCGGEKPSLELDLALPGHGSVIREVKPQCIQEHF